MKHWNPAISPSPWEHRIFPGGRRRPQVSLGAKHWGRGEGGGLRRTPASCGLWVLEVEASFVGQRRQVLGRVWRWHVAEDVKAWVGVQTGKCNGKDSSEVPSPSSECIRGKDILREWPRGPYPFHGDLVCVRSVPGFSRPCSSTAFRTAWRVSKRSLLWLRQSPKAVLFVTKSPPSSPVCKASEHTGGEAWRGLGKACLWRRLPQQIRNQRTGGPGGGRELHLWETSPRPFQFKTGVCPGPACLLLECAQDTWTVFPQGCWHYGHLAK